MDRWMDGQVDGWTDGRKKCRTWVDGQLDGWMDSELSYETRTSLSRCSSTQRIAKVQPGVVKLRGSQ